MKEIEIGSLWGVFLLLLTMIGLGLEKDGV